MKTSGNKCESRKRKRDGSKEGILESPKKAKVHAQRKFAQGANFNSPAITQIKDKVRPPVSTPASGPMLTSKCPNTEDFLTFLCFRRTSILPAKLDFFKDAVGSDQESASPAKKATLLSSSKNTDNNLKQTNKKGDKKEDGKKSQSHAVQALRKKYQEQRLAKQKGTNVTKLAQKVKGKNMVRTRSSTLADNKKTVKNSNLKEKNKSDLTSLRSGHKRSQALVLKASKKIRAKGLRSGLRSGNDVLTKEIKSVKVISINAKKTEQGKKRPKSGSAEAKAKETKTKKIEGFSDFSSDDNEPLLKVNKLKEIENKSSHPKSGPKKVVKNIAVSLPSTNKPFVKTRSRGNESEPANLSSRPTRKTKEAAAIYMEMITKKLVSPEKSGDDDVSSVDSFPELPNAKRNEQRETEIKAKALAFKKVEVKLQLEDKNSKVPIKNNEIKKASVKYKNSPPKADVKSSKFYQKKEIKDTRLQGSGSTAVKKINRRTLKEDSPKKQNTGEVQKENATTSSRPSTRSTYQEEFEETFTKEESKVSPVKTVKPPKNKKDKKTINKDLPESKRTKPIKTAKVLNPSQKVAVDETEKRITLNLDSIPESKMKTTRKSSKNIEEKCESTKNIEEKCESTKNIEEKCESTKNIEEKRESTKNIEEKRERESEKRVKKEFKPKQEISKEINITKKRDKFSDLNEEGKKKEIIKGKNKKKREIKKRPEKVEKGEKGQVSSSNQRPTRKCSAVDKIWIDIDGFTSDEDEFANALKTTKPKLSLPKGTSEKRNTEPQGKDKESELNKEKKPKKEKSFGSDKDSKEESKKVKTEEVKVEGNTKSEKSSLLKPKVTVKIEPQFKSIEKAETYKSEDSKQVDRKSSRKKENESVVLKELKVIATAKEELEKSEEKAETTSSNVKSKSDFHKSTEKFITSSEDKNLLKDSVSVTPSKEPQTILVTKKELKRQEEQLVCNKKVRKTKGLQNEDASNVESETKIKKGKKLAFKSEKIKSDSGQNVDVKAISGVEEEESENGRRKRPVRQCSTREKRWIETDSDSFSFYETSDEEDNLRIFEKNGDQLKSSPPKNEAKETNYIKGLENEKKTEPRSDNFSESDDEPLKKKALVVEREIVKVAAEAQPEDVVKLSQPNKTQREMPGLHPLKRSPIEVCAKEKEVSQEVQGVALRQEFASASGTDQKVGLSRDPAPPSNDQNLISMPEASVPRTMFNENPNILLPEPNFEAELRESPDSSMPKKIEMILHSLQKDKESEGTTSYSEDVKVTFAKVPCRPPSFPPGPSQMSHVPYSFTINTAIFPPPREPISTHGLDLLSEVAIPTSPKEKMSSQTERIEKWLKDSLAADHKKRFSAYDESMYKSQNKEAEPSKIMVEKSEPNYYCGKSISTPPKSGLSSHFELQKFGQLELLESQKLLKRNLFCAEGKQETNKVEPPLPAVKKPLTSVQDLLKLQKERKEATKTVSDNAPHLKNCKCNNCIVKKGWFKNKPAPKTHQRKSSPLGDCDDSAKPFESLTKAFTKISPDEKSTKVSVSVAPMVVHASTVSADAMLGTSKEKNERKGIFPQRKLSFLERMRERERKEAAAKVRANAFSAEDERSVYAFEPEPEQAQGASTPFRSKTRDSRTSSLSKSDEENLRICESETSEASSTGARKTEKSTQEVKGPSKILQSASIAVQVNLDSEVVVEAEPDTEAPDGKSIEISTQTEVPEEDSDSPMFYIPLQHAKTADSSSGSDQQLIQGVALKLGTEGPMGPNQRVIMKAKLVTKPPDTSSIKAVVMPQPKRLFDQKNNNPPVGTVQPTTRKPPDASLEEVPGKSSDADSVVPSKPPEPVRRPETVASETDGGSTTNSRVGLKAVKSSSVPIAGKLASKKKEKTNSESKGEATEDRSATFPASSSSKVKKGTKPKNPEVTSISGSSSHFLCGSPSKLMEAPTFHPTEKDFQDPFEFFERIRPAAEKFGLCRIVPPANFKPDCKVSDDMRFTAYNQYVHRMFHRWGPNIKEMMAIKKYLMTQSISLKQPPWIGGIEVDLPRLYQSVQNCGGLMKVMEKKKWNQVADMMKIPKAAQDRVTKLDDIYCKYLLPYDTLSHDERQKLFDEVEKDWTDRQRAPAESQGEEEEAEEENYIEECEECVVKGRNMALNQFYRIARNTMTMWFKNSEPSPREVENEFWKHVRERNHHVCVHSGSIDSSGWGYGFPVAKNNSFSKHPWNLKVLTNNCGSVLRSLGPVMGVTVPTLHVGMVFTAFCWYRDPHGLPWIEYLHTGAPKIWYGISDDNSKVFKDALAKLLPRYTKNKTIWLPSDTAMIPPDLLVDQGVSLCHTVQEPGQFILVFPRAFTSSICTGYLVSESVYFAQPSWLATAEQVFKDIQESCEPSMFSLEKLLFSIAADSRSSVEVLKQILPMIWHLRQKEIDGRKTLCNLGLKSSERLPPREFGGKKKKGRWAQEDDGDHECEVCRKNLYVSLVIDSLEEAVYCLPHAADHLTQKRHQLKHCKLLYTHTQEEIKEMVEKLEQKIESKSQKKLQSKSGNGKEK